MNASVRNAYGDGMTTASPARLLVMLFERLGRDVEQAVLCQEAGDHLAANPLLIHAQQIIMELRSSLRHDVWDGAANLDAIYAWLHGRLIHANVNRDATITRECQGIIDPLVETWREAALASALAG